MKRSIDAGLVTSAVLALISLTAQAVVLEGCVTSVADGDTIRVQTEDGSIRVRFLGIDAPESDQAYGREAKLALSGLILNKTVRVRTESTDRYGRRLGQVAYQDRDVGLYLLENGCAWVYPQYIDSVEPDWQDAYVIAERAARREGIGLWENIDPTPPWTWRKEKRERQAVAEEAVRPTDEQALASNSKEVQEKFSELSDAVRNAARRDKDDNRARLDSQPTWWQLFSDLGEVLSRWLISFFRSFL